MSPHSCSTEQSQTDRTSSGTTGVACFDRLFTPQVKPGSAVSIYLQAVDILEETGPSKHELFELLKDRNASRMAQVLCHLEKEVLPLIRSANQLQVDGWPVDWVTYFDLECRPSFPNSPNDPVGKAAHLRRVLDLQAQTLLIEGCPDQVVDACADWMNFNQNLMSTDLLKMQLFALGSERECLRALSQVVEASPQSAMRLRKRLCKREYFSPLRRVAEFRKEVIECLQSSRQLRKMFSDRHFEMSGGKGSITDESIQFSLEAVDAVLSEGIGPPHQNWPHKARSYKYFEIPVPYPGMTHDYAEGMILVNPRAARNELIKTIVLCALAAKQYELDHGRLPASLEQLDGQYVNPMTGQPIDYKLRDDTFLLLGATPGWRSPGFIWREGMLDEYGVYEHDLPFSEIEEHERKAKEEFEKLRRGP
jgi:hypothetical protein